MEIVVEKYSHFKTPYSLDTADKKNAEKSSMDFHIISYFVSFIGLIILMTTMKNIPNQYGPVLGILIFGLFLIFAFSFIISLFKFTIKIIVVMIRTENWLFLLLTLITGSLWLLIYYFMIYRRFLIGKLTLNELVRNKSTFEIKNKKMLDEKMPRGVVTFGILQLIIAGFTFFAKGLAFAVFFGALAFGVLEGSYTLQAYNILLIVVSWILGIAGGIAAIGTLMRKPWGRKLLMWVAGLLIVLNIILIIIVIIISPNESLINSIIWTVIKIGYYSWIVVYFSKKEIKKYFG